MVESLSFDDVLLIPRYSKFKSRSETDISVEFCGKKNATPLIMSPMTCVTSPEMMYFGINNGIVPTVHRYFRDVETQFNTVLYGLVEQIDLEHKGIDCLDWENRIKNRDQTKVFDKVVMDKVKESIKEVYFSVGSVLKYKDWIDYLWNHGIRKFCVDMAHGDSLPCVKTVEYLRKKDVDVKIIAGNVATSEGYKRLCESGADAIRCSIGGGSVCTTRMNTGFGVPNLTCLQDISTVKHKDCKVIIDGGIRAVGDMTKSIVFGADMVMLGKILASTSLSSGQCYNYKKQLIDKTKAHYDEIIGDGNDVCYKEYNGMASEKSRNGILNYGSVEGVSGLLIYKGQTKKVVDDIKLNLHSALSYGGCKDFVSFRKKVKYNLLSNASIVESATHLDITE